MERSLYQDWLHTKIRIAHFFTGLTGLEEANPTLYGKFNLKWRMQTVCFNWI